jgi:hypothetical protein
MDHFQDKANELIRVMTVDMVIDFEQTKQCAINACYEVIKSHPVSSKTIGFYLEVIRRLEDMKS